MKDWMLVGARALSLAIALGSSSCRSDNTPQNSSTSHWVACDARAECTDLNPEYGCEDGFCVDAQGERVRADTAAPTLESEAGTAGSVNPQPTSGAPSAGEAGATSTNTGGIDDDPPGSGIDPGPSSSEAGTLDDPSATDSGTELDEAGQGEPGIDDAGGTAINGTGGRSGVLPEAGIDPVPPNTEAGSDDPNTTDSGTGADVGDDSGAPGTNGGLPPGVDCSTCTEAEVCWYTTDEEGALSRFGCVALPSACIDDASCDCINGASEEICDELGWVQNGNACRSVGEIELVYCVSTLG